MRAYERYRITLVDNLWEVRGFPGDDLEGDYLKTFSTRELAEGFVSTEMQEEEIPEYCGLRRAYVFENIRTCRDCSHYHDNHNCEGHKV